MFYIKRNTKEFGPFNADKVKAACVSGNILLRDLIRHENTQKHITVAEFIELNNIQIQQTEERIDEVFFNIFKLQSVFINPFKYLNSSIKENAIIYILLAIVLIPVLTLFTSGIPMLSYSIYGVYFASIWVLILYKIIATKQTDLKIILTISITTILASIFSLELFHQTSIWSVFEKLIYSNNIISKFFAMLFGVAILEETLKQLFVYVTIIRVKKVILPRTAILYGMIAGLSFGIFEGIEYQMNLNKSFSVDVNYFTNIIRITSLPFFHAIWAGIGAYFISLSFIELKYKYSFRIMGLFIPALLHALYNTFGLNVFGIAIIILSSILLTVYLTKSDMVGKQLNNI
ncbi:PrsW family glutamic-type intramembrane protease [Winogradskyella sp.]|nr:PrsW family glutamic-type intramembrane protease [Winogradskyella sp.]